MDNIVYILGAGFSAPLGLPVVSNFISKAHDIYQNHREIYPHFLDVFNSIKNRLASIALIYQADLDNIEEVLSILEMELLNGENSLNEVVDINKFIIDVIRFYSPPVKEFNKYERVSKGLYKSEKGITLDEFSNYVYLERMQEGYARFVFDLLNVDISINGKEVNEENKNVRKSKFETLYNTFSINSVPQKNINARYSVVSLNYDLTLENIASYYSNISSGNVIGFSRPNGIVKDELPLLAKLHGSIDTNTIIPPTWNKSIHEKINLEWKAAHKALSSANQIRFVGYSLPDGDAYVKYLLKSSMIQTEHLKNIDVICLDHDGYVKRKFDNFIAPQFKDRYRFANTNVINLLMDFMRLEEKHDNIMRPKALGD